MDRPKLGLLGDAVLVLSVLIVALWAFTRASERVAFYGDEGRYIARGRFFGDLLLRHDLLGPEWGDSDSTHTQPMLTNYLVGGWLWANGRNLATLPPPYRWGWTPEQNDAQGRIPDQSLLAQARAPMIALTAGVVVLLYALGRLLDSPLAGLAAAAIGLASPLVRQQLVLAVAEAPLAFFILLALLLASAGVKRGRAGGLSTGWAVAVGVALGLGLGTKLTALLSLIAAAGWGLSVAVLAARLPAACLAERRQRFWRAGRGWALALSVALGIYVLSNPHLYPNPFLHTAHLFQNRSTAMQRAQRDYPEEAVRNPLERPGRVLGGSLIDGTLGGSRRVPLEAALASLGFAALAARVWRGRARRSAETLVLLTLLSYVAGISAGLLVAWPRYLVPTVLFGALLSGLGLAIVARSLMNLSATLAARPEAPREARAAAWLTGSAGPRA